MYRPGGMSSDDSDWDDDYFSQNVYCEEKIPPPCQLSLEEMFVLAVTDRDISKVKELISQRVDVNFQPTDNWNAVIRASSMGCLELIKLLVEHGANVNSSYEKFTPILALCCSPNRDEDELESCMKFLLSNGAKINACDWYRISPLSHAVRHNHVKLAQLLISLNADIHATDQDGWTPIFYAVDCGYIELVSILKDCGANIFGVDKRGRTLVDIAIEKDYLDIVKLISCVSDVEEWFLYKLERSHNVHENILSQIPLRSDRLSGFRHDVFIILQAVQLSHLNGFFLKNNVGLGHLLCYNESSLKKIGIKFWFERRKIIRMVEKFHEFPWHLNSFGNVISQSDLDLFQTAQLMATIMRQMYIISVTSYRYKKHFDILPESKTFPDSIRESLKTVKIVRKKLISIRHLIKKIDKEQTSTSSDLILPVMNSSKFNFKIIISASCLAALLLCKSNFMPKLF